MVSARTTYLLIACVIALLFAGTGAYYVLDIQNKKEQKQAETYLAQTEPEKPSPTSTPKPSITPTPKTTTQEETETTTDSIKNSLSTSCYDICEYDHNCPGELKCLPVKGVNRCVNESCKEESSCICEDEELKESTSSAVPEIFVAEGDTEGGTGGTSEDDEFLNEEETTEAENDLLADAENEVEETIVENTADEETTTTVEEVDPSLPKAGSTELTFALLTIGITISSLGFVWKKS
jgi:hypothetical protein